MVKTRQYFLWGLWIAVVLKANVVFYKYYQNENYNYEHTETSFVQRKESKYDHLYRGYVSF